MTTKANEIKSKKITEAELLQIRDFATNELNKKISPAYIIHNWNYTEELIENAEYIINEEGIPEESANISRAILYFYNIGYAINPCNPVETSAKCATDFLEKNKYSKFLIEEIRDGILNTDNSQCAPSQSIAVAQDALNAYQGQKKIKKHLVKGLEEFNIAHDQTIDEVKWISDEIKKMTIHRFCIQASRKKWKKRKEKNLKKLRRYLNEIKRKSSLTYNKRAMTMFKTASRNQIDLVNIADKKAGIMITVNAVLLTIMLPLFASYIIDMSRFLIPSMILVLTCGVSIILATLATKPVSKPGASRKDFVSGDRSLFFFRNFIKLKKEDYKSAIQELIVRDGPFENAVMTDLYDLGVTLGIKYRKLTWCYWVFAIGIGLTIITFILSTYLTHDIYL